MKGIATSIESKNGVRDANLDTDKDKNSSNKKKDLETTGKTESQYQAKQQKEPIKVLVADDHQMVRQALIEIMEREDDINVIAKAKNGVEVVSLTGKINPDVVVMDINMPEMNGIKATQKITENDQELKVIALSIHDKDNMGEAMKKAGANAYITKNEAVETLCKTIRKQYYG